MQSVFLSAKQPGSTHHRCMCAFRALGRSPSRAGMCELKCELIRWVPVDDTGILSPAHKSFAMFISDFFLCSGKTLRVLAS